MESAVVGASFGYHVTATGFPPDATVRLQATTTGGGLSGVTVGTTDATGGLDESVVTHGCGAGGMTLDVALLVDGSVLTTQQVTHVTC